MKKIEKELEEKCINFARSHGWDCWKNENNGNKGIPDHSLLHPDGRFLLVEFKASEDSLVRYEQMIWMHRHPYTVRIVWDFKYFCSIIGELPPTGDE